MYQSRLKRAGLFAFGVLVVVGTVGLALRDGEQPAAARGLAAVEDRRRRRVQGSGIMMALSGISRRFLGAEVAIPLNQLTAHPDEVEAAVQRMIAGQAFDASSKSSEQELMQ
jgi:hypothetical protein